MTRIRMLAIASAALLMLTPASSAAPRTMPSAERFRIPALSDEEIRSLLLSRQPTLSRADEIELRMSNPELWRKRLEEDQARRQFEYQKT